MFSQNLLKIYFTKFLGIFGSILSMTIVLPFISSNVEAYGIYTLVISLMILLQFADLGFLGAGQKYAAEYFAKKQLKLEIETLSFVHYILFLAVCVYVFFLCLVYNYPSIIFNDTSPEGVELGRNLIFIFICFSPIIVFQRYISAIYSIRIEDYINQIIEIIGNLIKIISVFYFFNETKYDIVGYVFFVQFINLLICLLNIIIIKKRYKYELIYVLKSFKFNKKIFDLTKNMAIASVIISVSWILYYELDLVYVSKLYSTSVVAFFAIGVTILSFSRNLMNIIFSPFQAKFNHLRGLKDEKSLNKIFFQIIELSFPISIISTLVILVLMEPLIISWIGIEYIKSILIGKILITTLMFSFLLVPISYLAFAREKYFFIKLNAVSLPILYFSFFYIFQFQFDELAIPISKALTIFCNLIINMFFIKHIINESIVPVLKRTFRDIIIPLILLTILLFVLEPFWNIGFEKQLNDFLQVVTVGGFIGIIPILTYYCINTNCRKLIQDFLNSVLRK